jgi:hypothetical protein
MSDRDPASASDPAADDADRGATGRAPNAGNDVASDPAYGAATNAFESELEHLGFRLQGTTRRGGRQWLLAFNRYLSFTVHDHADGADAVVLTWSCALGDYLDARGWQLSVTDLSTAELYPQRDVRLPADAEAVRGEITRVLSTLRIDLGDPAL